MLKRGGRVTRSLRRALIILPVWAVCVYWMWSWWLTADYIRFLPIYIPLTAALFYEFAFLPSIFLYFVIRAKEPPRRVAPRDKKVAVISLCVPKSESLDIVESQLEAMSKIKYPHDSWILDEGNSKQIKAMARKYGVKHFSRRGIKKYNQPGHPFQKKTKAGNVNAWLNHVKRYNYDYFVQLDIDHIPKPNYLNKTIGYFRDPKVGWVQAPSVYKNFSTWTARGAAEQELVLQGPLQMGFYAHSATPFIIGSHCTYRMSAINEIGGFQPTRAEDHLDTVYLANHGYTGVFLPEVIAEGDGPETLNTYLAQQFAWAYSMIQVLMSHSPRLLLKMPAKRKWQFLFAQTWYPLWTLSYLTMFISPVVALLLNRDVVQVNPADMLRHFIPLYVCGFLVWWSARPIMQPRNLMLSWRGIILHAVRWPIILRAIISAIFKVKKPYMITPKGKFARMVPSISTYRPFLYLGLLSALTAAGTSYFRRGHVPEAQVVYTITNSVFMLTVCIVDLSLRIKNSKPKFKEFTKLWAKPTLATASMSLVLVFSIATSALSINNSKVSANANISKATVLVRKPVNYEMTTDELIDQIRLIPVKHQETPKLGMYNQANNLPKTTTPYMQHSFVDWRDDHYLAFVVAQTLEQGNIPLITIEPRGVANGTELLEGIAAGSYDDTLNKISTVLSASKTPVHVRFAHEMELSALYPWGDQTPQSYIDAYRYTVAKLRTNNNLLKFVWSPAGNHGAEDYYPGDDYVDFVGTTILYDQYWYGNGRPSFKQLSSRREWLQKFGKPVWVVEFGVGNANKQFQSSLIDEAIDQYSKLGYDSLIYLNMVDANIVGPNYSLNSVNDFGKFFVPDSISKPETVQEVGSAQKAGLSIMDYLQNEDRSINYILPKSPNHLLIDR